MTQNIKVIDQLNLQNKRVFIRVDFNVPLAEGRVADPTRIEAVLPTVHYALDHGAKVILASHLGRPKGKRTPELSLKPVSESLSNYLGIPVKLAPDCVGSEVEAMVEAMQPGEVLLLENLRFHPEETKNEENFARSLARFAEVYVNDAFGAAHRAHASTTGLAAFVPERGAGFLLKKECDYLGKVLADPERPFVAILGGAKVSDKIPVISSLLELVDSLLIGGAMAYTFLRSLRVTFLPARWGLISARKPSLLLQMRSLGPARFSGTGRWECLKNNPLIVAPWPWPSDWQRAQLLQL